MDLRQLDYFLKVARRRSITGAAAELNVTQPTLTKSIKLLEHELGVALFERLPRGVELTEFGRSLLRHAEAVQVQVQDAVKEIDGLRGGAIGLVNVGAGPAWLRRHLPAAIARGLAANPGMRVRVHGGFEDVLLRQLRQGELDFVVAELPSLEHREGLTVTPLSSDRLGVCCRAGHPLAGRGPLEPEPLLRYPWAMPPKPTRAHGRLDALFVAHNLPAPEPAVETDSMAFLLQYVRQSDALTFTVYTTLAAPDGFDLAMLEVPAFQASREAAVIVRGDGWLSPAARAIIAELAEICAAEPFN